ncbi:hypothetical protein ALMP_11310 [Streptomyces sp. A012304]|nr:hypothetical protein ALMP_11310 [Streptomyces sp. A012304]
MSYRPYPNARRALHHVARGYRLARQTWRDDAGKQVEVRSYDGVMSKGVEAEVRRLLNQERRRRHSAR